MRLISNGERESASFAWLSFVAPPLLVLLAMALDGRVIYNRWDNFEYFSVATADAHDHWLRGEVPHWNPHQHMGEPTIGTIQPAPFYPLYTFVRLCMRVFGTPVEYFPPIATLLHLGIAGLGWYYLLRLLFLHPAVALLAAASGATSGFSLILSQVWIFVAATFAWIPWILLGVVGTLRHTPAIRHQIALAIGLANSLLIGYPQFGVYSWLFAGWFAVIWACFAEGAPRRLVRLCVVALGAALVAAPAWLPGLEFFLDSARTSKWPLAEYEAGSVLPGVALLDWLLPSFAYSTLYDGLHSAYGFQGAWLVPALVGVHLLWRRYPGNGCPWTESDKALRRYLKIALFCGMVPYLLAIGKYTRLTTVLYGIPVWSSFRNPYKFLPFFLACFLMAAACALEICWRHRSEFRSRTGWWTAAAGTFALWAANQWFIRKLSASHNPGDPGAWRGLPDLAVSLGCAILGATVLVVWLRNSRWLIALVPAQIVLLVSLCNQANLRTYRLGSMRVSPDRMGIRADYRVLPLSPFRSSESFDHMGEYGLFHTATLNGYYSATGCAAPSMLPKWYVRWLPSNEYGLLAGSRDINQQRVGTNLLRGYNVRYYLTSKGDSKSLKVLQGVPGMRLVSEQDETLVYEDPQALPRIWFASEVRRYSENAVEEALLRNQEPPTVAFLEGELPESNPKIGRLVVSSWNGSGVRVVLETREPAFLVVAATWYPGWKGWLDGKAVPVQRVNGTLLGIAIPANASELALVYRTSGLPAAYVLAAAGLTCLAIACGFRGRRKNQRGDGGCSET